MGEKIYILETVLEVITRAFGYERILYFLSKVGDSGEQAPSKITDTRIETSIANLLDSIVDGRQRFKEMNGIVLVVFVRVVGKFKWLLLE